MASNPEEIKNDILDQLSWDTRVEASEIKVDLSSGRIILWGTVPSYVSRWFAEQDARSVAAGKLEVRNQLVVRLPEETKPLSDDDITTAVKNVLMWNPVIESANIEVVVVRGLVTLEGTVDAYWKKMRVENLVSGIRGVLDIINRISVVPTRNFLDETIARDIVRAVSRTLAVDMSHIDIRVENGLVTLTGKAPNRLASYVVESTAQHSPGVMDVKNNIVVDKP
ncbi:MAG: BON domain-containing protein [Candidatus Omnitrophota bacterium]